MLPRTHKKYQIIKNIIFIQGHNFAPNLGKIAGWIDPVKDGATRYRINHKTFKLTTESIYGSKDTVTLVLYNDRPKSRSLAHIFWRFSDWGYSLQFCSLYGYGLKFPVHPPNEGNKVWELTTTAIDLKLKCNDVEVLHFIFNKTYDDRCTEVKWNTAAEVAFLKVDTATKKFTSTLITGRHC